MPRQLFIRFTLDADAMSRGSAVSGNMALNFLPDAAAKFKLTWTDALGGVMYACDEDWGAGTYEKRFCIPVDRAVTTYNYLTAELTTASGDTAAGRAEFFVVMPPDRRFKPRDGSPQDRHDRVVVRIREQV